MIIIAIKEMQMIEIFLLDFIHIIMPVKSEQWNIKISVIYTKEKIIHCYTLKYWYEFLKKKSVKTYSLVYENNEY